MSRPSEMAPNWPMIVIVAIALAALAGAVVQSCTTRGADEAAYDAAAILGEQVECFGMGHLSDNVCIGKTSKRGVRCPLSPSRPCFLITPAQAERP